MFCPNCGKQIKDFDNFCRFCGTDLRDSVVEEPSFELPKQEVKVAVKPEETFEEKFEDPVFVDDREELVLYDVKKHWMSLFWSAFFIPVFFGYFWNIFLNTHSIFSWIVVLLLFVPIIYPILRYNSDKMIITNKFIHVKIGILNPIEIDIPYSKLNSIKMIQTSMGNMLGYSCVEINHNYSNYGFGYVANPDDLEFILENPAKFIKDSLEEN